MFYVPPDRTTDYQGPFPLETGRLNQKKKKKRVYAYKNSIIKIESSRKNNITIISQQYSTNTFWDVTESNLQLYYIYG